MVTSELGVKLDMGTSSAPDVSPVGVGELDRTVVGELESVGLTVLDVAVVVASAGEAPLPSESSLGGEFVEESSGADVDVGVVLASDSGEEGLDEGVLSAEEEDAGEAAVLDGEVEEGPGRLMPTEAQTDWANVSVAEMGVSLGAPMARDKGLGRRCHVL